MKSSRNVGMHPGASAQTSGASAQTSGASAQTSGASTQTPGASTQTPGASTNHPGASTLPQRKNIRAVFHDYSGGDYFVTICTQDKEHFFGKIQTGKMIYTAIGAEAHRCMETLATHYSYVKVPLFVIMPNHVHAIICIREPAADAPNPAADAPNPAADAPNPAADAPTPTADAPGCIPTIRTALGVVVGGYKQAVTRFARRNNIEFGWQKRYHDHIIRGIHDGNYIAEYIENNVASWAQDCFYE